LNAETKFHRSELAVGAVDVRAYPIDPERDGSDGAVAAPAEPDEPDSAGDSLTDQAAIAK